MTSTQFLVLITFIGLVFNSCTNNPEENISLYDPANKLIEARKEINFWENKLESTAESRTYKSKLAAALTEEFSLTADIESLKKAEELLQQNIAKSPNNCNARRALARNYISQHKFKEAQNQLLKAKEIGEDMRYTNLLLFDVAQELANDDEADLLLEKISTVKDFNYLIRAAKWQDGNGNLDKAITLLEEAQTKAVKSQNENQLSWIYSNLGDFYGHAGRLVDSKISFEKALELNPADYYSYKGLAYMEWAAENNTKQSLKMIKDICAHSSDPSVLILKADILEHLGEQDKANGLRNSISTTVSAASYGAMYNSFLIQNSLTQKNIAQANKLAELEIETRRTPESYALLAVTKYYQNQKKEALELALNEVVGKTFEPKVLMNILPVTEQVDSVKKAILSEVKEAKYELGPLAYNKLTEH